MTVCRYFRNGYCRNGDSCRFEHLYYNQRPPLLATPGYHSGQQSSGYGPRAGSPNSGGDWRNQEQQQQQHHHHNHHHHHHHQQQQQQQQPQQQQQEPSVTEQLLTTIDLMLRGKQYLFSCVPGRQLYLNCSGFSDLSPEEIHMKFLELQASNNQQRFISEMASHREFVEGGLRRILRNPSMLDDVQPRLASSVVQAPTFADGNFAMSSATAATPAMDASTGPSFGGASSSSPFAASSFAPQPQLQPQPSFGTMSSMSAAHNQQPMMDVAHDQQRPQTLFGKPVQPAGGGLFDRSQTLQPAFGQTQQAAPAAFAFSPPQAQFQGQAQAQATAQTMPSQTAPAAASAVRLPTSDNISAAPAPHQRPVAASQKNEIYTPLDELGADDVAAYQERAFTIARIPLVPPAREHCFQ